MFYPSVLQKHLFVFVQFVCVHAEITLLQSFKSSREYHKDKMPEGI